MWLVLSRTENSMISHGVVGSEIGMCVMFEPCIIVCTFLLYFDLNICRKWLKSVLILISLGKFNNSFHP